MHWCHSLAASPPRFGAKVILLISIETETRRAKHEGASMRALHQTKLHARDFVLYSCVRSSHSRSGRAGASAKRGRVQQAKRQPDGSGAA
eukprot:2648727-Pleurochrysis_carterae.AAC.1